LVLGKANWYLGNIFNSLCGVAVNCFVLLSGYFLCTASFKLSKLTSIWIQTMFYSVVLYLICASVAGFSLTELIKSAMVLILQRYWFVTAYLLLYMLFPFLNYAIHAMNKRTHFLCCCVLLGIFSVLHNLVYISDFGYINGGSSLLWFCVLYIIAAYIRLYVPVKTQNRKKYFFLYLVGIGFVVGTRFLAYAITPQIFGRVMFSSLFHAKNSVPTVCASIGFFLFFRTLTIRSEWLKKCISFFAPLAFAVYLIHDHPTVRTLLWQWLNPADFAESPWMLAYAAICIISIFIMCCIIEWIRQIIFHICRVDKLITRCSSVIQCRVSSWLQTDKKNE